MALRRGQGPRRPRPTKGLEGRIHGAKWADGKHGKALDFDGKDDYVSLGKADVYGSDFTMTAWIRPRSFARVGGTIISKERNSLGDFNLRPYVAPGGRLGFWITDDMRSNIWPVETAPGSIPANRWTFVAARRSGVTHTLYINGKPVVSKRSKVVIRHGSDLEMRIGGRYPPAGSGSDAVGECPFDGLIDEVRFYVRGLSDQELAAPDALPDGMWRKVGAWDSAKVKRAWKTLQIDLSGGIPVAGQYEVELFKTTGKGSLEIRSAMLVLEGVETPGFARKLDRPNTYNVNRTAAPTGKKRSTALKLTVRQSEGGNCSGVVRIRARK